MKIGDKYICIKEYESYLQVDKIYKVKFIHKSSKFPLINLGVTFTDGEENYLLNIFDVRKYLISIKKFREKRLVKIMGK